MQGPTLRMQDAAAHLEVVSGEVRPDAVSLYATMRNEMALLPAFLAHYRGLGYAQFLIFDDSSDDGSLAYLSAQRDVVVLQSELGYGAPVVFEAPDGERRQERAGIYFKIAAPHVFCPDAYVSYFDADEFLFLPPGVSHIGEVIDRLRAEGDTAVVSTLVEFFPEHARGLKGALPQSFEGLITAYPWFEPDPLVALRAGEQPKLIGAPKTAQLFERFAIKPQIERRGWHRIYMPSKAKKAQAFQKSPRHKTPIVLRSADSYLIGTHKANRPPSSTILLSAAHFVFTSQFADKIARAQAWGAHANGAAKYKYYKMLLDKIEADEAGFLSPRSVRFSSAQDLVDAGLMRW
ncbi:glycosyltransferase family 2 protein [Roseobacteraceae bacterium S113]